MWRVSPSASYPSRGSGCGSPAPERFGQIFTGKFDLLRIMEDKYVRRECQCPLVTDGYRNNDANEALKLDCFRNRRAVCNHFTISTDV